MRSFFAASIAVLVRNGSRGSNGKWLLGCRANEPWKNRWSLPGGRAERDETPRQTAARELKEETQIELLPQDIHLLEEFTQGDLAGLVVHFAVLESDYELIQPIACDDLTALKWLSLDEILSMDEAEKTPLLDQVMQLAQKKANEYLSKM